MERTCFLGAGVSHILSYISNMIKGITARGPHFVKPQVLSIQFGYVELFLQVCIRAEVTIYAQLWRSPVTQL